MAVNQLTPPDEAKRAFLQGLGEGAPELLFSAPIFGISLKELRNANLDTLRPKLLGWQFVAKDAQGRAVSGEVDFPSDEIATSLSRGKNADQALAAFLKVNNDNNRRQGDFELRRLRLSALRLDAFWLTSLPFDGVLSEKDMLYAFAAFQAELRSRFLQTPEFLRRLRDLARKEFVSVKPNIDTRRRR